MQLRQNVKKRTIITMTWRLETYFVHDYFEVYREQNCSQPPSMEKTSGSYLAFPRRYSSSLKSFDV